MNLNNFISFISFCWKIKQKTSFKNKYFDVDINPSHQNQSTYNNKMSAAKPVNKSWINTGNNIIELQFDEKYQEELEISYTNNQYKTFKGKISQEIYKNKMTNFSQKFPQIKLFLKMLVQNQIKIKLISDVKLQFKLDLSIGTLTISIIQQFELEDLKQTRQELLQKELKEIKKKIKELEDKDRNSEELTKNILQQIQSQNQRKVKKIEEDHRKKEQQWEKNLKKIYQQYGQYKPEITSELLKNPISSKTISILTLPVQYRQKMEIFKRLLFHDPKAIVSVFGLANVGKSTLMTQIMHCINNHMGNNQNRKEFFPAHSSALTFYDSFYVFHQNALNIQYSKDIKRQKVLFDEYFENESCVMSIFMDDMVKFVDKKGEDFKEIHQKRRQQIQSIKQMKIKQDKFNERFMIIRNNADIMDSQNRKLSYLNKYIALLDRAGFNDKIYTLVNSELRQREQKQLFKIKNDIVLYCFQGQQIENADDKTEGHLLQLMKTHDFEKIILCVNMFSNFSESEQIKNINPKDRQVKVYEFIKYMLVSIPKYICNFISKHMDSLYKQSQQCQQKIKLKTISKDEGNILYQKDRTLREHLNRYGDQLQKYQNILSNFTKFWNSIKNKIQKQLTRQLQDQIEKKLKQYPFQNVHFYGLTRYYDFEFIKNLGIISKAELYKTLGRQSLNSIQKFYFNKLRGLDTYQSNIQKYYSDFPNFQGLVRGLKPKDLQSQKEQINKIKDKVVYNLKFFHTRIQTLNRELNINIQNEAQSSNDWYIKIGVYIWDKISSCYLQLQSIITKHETVLRQHKKKLLDLMLPKQLRNDILSPWGQVICQMVDLITKDISQFFDNLYKIMMKKWNMFVSSASQHLGFLVKDVVTEGALSYLKLGIRFNRSKYQKCVGCYHDNKIKDHTITDMKKRQQLFKQALQGFKLFTDSNKSIISDSWKDLNSCVSQTMQREFLLVALIDLDKDRKRMMAAERRKVQDAINELKLEYTQKLRRINYDMVLHCVTKEDK